MAFKIAVASGKGGTGKTTVAINLFQQFSQEMSREVMLVDCDVEEPNAALFYPLAKKGASIPVTREIPVIDTGKCKFCRKCVEYCEFKAILVLLPLKFAEISANLCHSCGACLVACQHKAIGIKEESIGHLNHYQTETGRGIMEGTLKIGSAMQTMVIRSLKQALPSNMDILVFDAPPGTSCPVVESITDADYVVLVTESTPFGLHDLKLMVSLVRKMGNPFGVVINKANLGTRDAYTYLKENHIEILCEIPFDRDYASSYSKGALFDEVPVEISEAFKKLSKKLIKMSNPT